MPEDLKYAERIAKLLRQAEATTFPEEADAFMAKAQQLMTLYAIDEATLEQLRDRGKREEVTQETIIYGGIFSRALFEIGRAVARANDCKHLIGRASRKTTTLYVIGFPSDIQRVRLIDSSLQLQAVAAQRRWWQETDSSWMNGSQKYRAKREFLFGFARGVATKLERAKVTGITEAAQVRAEREHVAITEASQAVALVLRSKEQSVRDWMDRTYGNRLRNVRHNYKGATGTDAHGSGRAAGRRANTGQPEIGGRRELRG